MCATDTVSTAAINRLLVAAGSNPRLAGRVLIAGACRLGIDAHARELMPCPLGGRASLCMQFDTQSVVDLASRGQPEACDVRPCPAVAKPMKEASGRGLPRGDRGANDKRNRFGYEDEPTCTWIVTFTRARQVFGPSRVRSLL